MNDLSIETANRSDAQAILTLQRLCYRREAELYEDETIPPLTQTLDDLASQFDTHRILVARLGSVVGSVRTRVDARVAYVGRLIVHPAFERRGIGTRLMHAAEAECADADVFELFTGHLSEGNLRLYARLGYTEVRRERASARVQLVTLQKRGTAARAR
jgi:ribosomal protein S18 acetylase RimI-like enzyme